MTKSKFNYTVGTVLILVGIAVPSLTLIKVLRGEPPIDIRQQLIVGATIFKIGLIIFGILFLARGRFSFFKLEKRPIEPLPDSNRRLTISILATILLTAFILRLYGLNNGLWYDEIITYVNYAKIPFGEIITTYDSQNNHMLYSLLAHSSFQIFGESAWSLRLPAVFFGVGSIWALYLLARQVTSVQEALLSVALVAFSYHHIWFSQNARGYTGLLFWTILASWLFLRGLREGKPQPWILYSISASLGVYTHMTMLFVIIGHFIIYLLMLTTHLKEIWLEKWVGLFLSFCLAGLFTFQLHALIFPQIFGGAVLEGARSTVMDWKNPFWTLLVLVKGMKIGFTGSVLAIAAFFVFGCGLFSFIRKEPLVVLLLTIPILVSIVVIMGMGHPLFPRTFFFTMGLVVLIIIRGTTVLGYLMGNLFRLSSSRSNLIGVVLCAGLIIVSAMSVPKAYAPKQDCSGALKFVEERKEPGDIIVTVGVATIPYNSLYNVDWEEAETLEELNSIRFRAERTWLLYTMSLHLKSVYPDIMSVIQSDFKVEKRFYGTLGDGTIVVCLSKAPLS